MLRVLFIFQVIFTFSLYGIYHKLYAKNKTYNATRVLIQDRITYEDHLHTLTIGIPYVYNNLTLTLFSCTYLAKEDVFVADINIIPKSGEAKSYWFYNSYPGDDKFSSPFINIRVLDCTNIVAK